MVIFSDHYLLLHALVVPKFESVISNVSNDWLFERTQKNDTRGVYLLPMMLALGNRCKEPKLYPLRHIR